ncbi:transglutaminase family protein [Thermodesulfobacteriota bacterium]
MITPPMLMAAALLFWGWQTGQMVPAALMALILEGARFVKVRWDFSAADFNRISDLCSLIVVGTTVYFFMTKRSPSALFDVVQWLPLTLFPLVVFYIYSTSDKIDVGALFLVLRKSQTQKETRAPVTLNLLYPYFVQCILSASAANVRNLWFYAGLTVLSAWALWANRSRRFSVVLWAGLFLIAAMGGYAGQYGLHQLQIFIETKGSEFFDDLIRTDIDPYQRKTAIGDIGELKQSDRIIFRVAPKTRLDHPLLLREASYNKYIGTGWFAPRARFRDVLSEKDGITWRLHPDPGEGERLQVFAYLRKGKGMLKLPSGSSLIERLPALKVARNQFGAVKVEEGPGLLAYLVHYSFIETIDSPPDQLDLHVPKQEAPAIYKIVQELELKDKSPPEILKTVSSFFQNKFRYTLVLNQKDSQATALSDFLVRSRAGHCEFFATATVLLLRAAGVPARYASGYSVQEFSGIEKRFVVRARHAHAWAMAHVDGRWQDFDTTPAAWFGLEAESAAVWEPLYDMGSWLWVKFSEWRWREGEGSRAKHAVWLLIPLALILIRRLYSRDKVKRVIEEKISQTQTRDRAGMDSEFYLIEKTLAESGFTRDRGETLSAWILGIEESRRSSFSGLQMQEILALHYRYRFDPGGVSDTERAELKVKVQSWLAHNNEPNKEGVKPCD